MTSIDNQKKISAIKLRTGIVLITATMINSYSYSELIVGSAERAITIFFVVFSPVVKKKLRWRNAVSHGIHRSTRNINALPA